MMIPPGYRLRTETDEQSKARLAASFADDISPVLPVTETKMPWTDYEARSYPADGNKGDYRESAKCRKCEKSFGGHRLREICRECATPANESRSE